MTIVAVTDEMVKRMPTTRGKGRIFKVFRFLEGLRPAARPISATR